MNASITIHDDYQFELKLNYPIVRGQKENIYEIGLYFFLPVNLGINSVSYAKQQFYSDLQTYIRVKTPAIPLKCIAEGSASPLARLRQVFEAIAQEPSKKPAHYESQLKLFCCILKSAMRDFVAYLHETRIAEDRERLINDYVKSVRQIATGYRDLRAIIQIPGFEKRMFEKYLFGDEYISLLIEDSTYHLLERLLSSGTGVSQQVHTELLAVIDGEVQYRRKREYPSIPEERNDNETLVFRRSVLKKYMSTVLFLDTEIEKGGFVVEQTLFGIAAAAAMFFATAIAFISQSVYGNLSLPFFIVLVVSYIFKDRIKDLLRFYLSRKMTRFIFDHKTKIYNAVQNIVGLCRESFEFIRHEKLAPEIKDLRSSDHITEIENGWVGERVMLYRRLTNLYPDWAGSIFSEYEIDAVHDIMRFNIQDFLRKMDDPSKELFMMDDEGYHRIRGTRVYHLNLIIKLVDSHRISYGRYRIVFNRQGIKRIEKVRTI